MIITKDMLIAKGASKQYIASFDFEFPQGFDFSKTDYVSTDYDLVSRIAYIMNYTGTYTNKGLVYLKQFNYINGKLNDFPNGNPAFVSWNLQMNVLERINFCKNGMFQNPALYLPASIYYYPNGVLRGRSFFEKDIFTNPCPGVPAFIHYDENGNIKRMLFA